MMSRNRCVAALVVSVALLLQGCETTPPVPVSPPPAEEPQPEPQRPPQPPAGELAPAEQPAAPPGEPAPVEKPEPAPAPVVCTPPPPPAPAPAPPKPRAPATTLAVLGELEYVLIDPPGMRFTARLDTGSATSSINALEVREFERDGKSWVKFRLVDAKGGKSAEVSRPVVRSLASKDPAAAKRYVVSLKATIAGIEQFTEFMLTDRSSSSQPALIGRNFLRDQAVVDVGRRFTRPDTKP
jgi:hypothetical protein